MVYFSLNYECYVTLVVRTIDDFKNNHYIAKLLSKIPHYISSIQQQLIESKQEIESKSQELQIGV